MRYVIYLISVMLSASAGTVFAGTYSGGTGTAEDPYLIGEPNDIIEMSSLPDDWGGHFLMMADVDLAGYTFERAVIAPDISYFELFQGSPFTGVFDGNRYKVINLTIDTLADEDANNDNNDYLGLFGMIAANGQVINLSLENSVVTGGGHSDYIGGISGYNDSGFIIRCYAKTSLTGRNYLGGLSGYNNGAIYACYSNGSVSGNNCVGGLVGRNAGSIEECYSAGLVSGNINTGGLVGYNYGDNVENCFWDTETSHQIDSDAGTGKTTAEMQALSTYTDTGWDFAGIMDDGDAAEWQIVPGDYPHLINEQIAPTYQFEGGDGSQGNPYRIGNVAQLVSFGSIVRLMEKHFVLTTDIDMGLCPATNSVIAPNGMRFEGSFDGNGHVIRNLTIEGPAYLGLFGSTGSNSVVKRLGIENASVNGSSSYVGALAGKSHGKIIECYSTGSVSGGSHTGGLIGHNSGNLNDCYSKCFVAGSPYVGGLTGYNDGSVFNCYSTGYGGGLAGSNSNFIFDSFWDIETSGVTESNGALGLDTSQMQQEFYYKQYNWGGDTWTIDEGNDYPHLAWENVEGQFIGYPEVAMEGSGTTGDPWVIDSKDDLISITEGSYFLDKSYVLNRDIDLSGATYIEGLIGEIGNPFNGSFDGNGHVINGLMIKVNGRSFVGLFGYAGSNCTISNLGLTDVDISGGGEYKGSLAGYNQGTIINCFSSGYIQQSNYVGGLVGYNSEGSISNCYSICAINARDYIGGLTGSNSGTIADCFSRGSAHGRNTVGGLVGENQGSVIKCYSTGSVTAVYSVVGGLVGSNNEGSVTDCFWDIDASGMTTSPAGEGKTLSEMKTISTFTDAGWDFSDSDGDAAVWQFPPLQYPAIAGSLSEIPDIRYINKTQAQLLLMDAGFYTGDITYVEGDSASAGNIESHWPAAGELLIKGNKVSLTVSLGDGYYPSGAGTKEDPWKISTPYDLYILSQTPADYARHFVLTTDIDVGVFSFTTAVIAPDAGSIRSGFDGTVFTGSFDGKGHKVTNLKIDTLADSDDDNDSRSYLGLFGQVGEEGEIVNLGIENVAIRAFGRYHGGLIGKNYGDVTNCYSTGSLSSSVRGLIAEHTGGLIGCTIKGDIGNCYSSCTVSGDKYVGGLIGSYGVYLNYEGGTISNCYSTGSVTGPFYAVGGLAGFGYKGNLVNSYSTGSVSGDECVGGLVGKNFDCTLTNCYSAGSVSGHIFVGGLIGVNGYPRDDPTGCFWDIQISGQASSDAGEGKTTAEMKTMSIFSDAGWDFVDGDSDGVGDVWRMCHDGVDYPRLSCEFGRVGDFACGDGVGVDDLVYLCERWLAEGESAGAADGDGDGDVDMADFAVMGGGFRSQE